jgi:D-alanyl-lipoteichoic acid acyltransferase DltB (MBOAT superfamily)
LSEFWGRWHISLSRWIRDYIYIPLGGNRLGIPRTLANIFLAMLISGIWHGAALKYIIWGAYHGIGLCIEKATKLVIPSRLGIVITFIFVTLGWIFFRSATIDSALIYFKGFLDWGIPMNPDFPHLGIALLALTSFAVWNYSEKLINLFHLALDSLPLVARPIPIALIITMSLALSPGGMPNFIYSQF